MVLSERFTGPAEQVPHCWGVRWWIPHSAVIRRACVTVPGPWAIGPAKTGRSGTPIRSPSPVQLHTWGSRKILWPDALGWGQYSEWDKYMSPFPDNWVPNPLGVACVVHPGCT